MGVNKMSKHPKAVPPGWIGIYTVDDLHGIRDDIYGKYILMADLDLGGVDWEPIWEFYGDFDGGNHTIRNFISDHWEYSGIFGWVEGSTIKNLIVENAHILNPDGLSYAYGSVVAADLFMCTIENIKIKDCFVKGHYVGGLSSNIEKCIVTNIEVVNTEILGYDAGAVAGYLYGEYGGMATELKHVNVVNCKTIDIVGSGEIGGVIGIGWRCHVEDCHVSNVDVYNTGYGGGIAGYAWDVSFKKCSFVGTLDTCLDSGGIVGFTHQAEIEDCFAKCHIIVRQKGTYYSYSLGGITADTPFDVVIKNCYAVVTYETHGELKNTVFGPIISIEDENVTITNTYYDSDIYNGTHNGYGIPKTTEEMKKQATFIDWDFDAVWTIKEGISYPFFVDKAFVKCNSVPLNKLIVN